MKLAKDLTKKEIENYIEEYEQEWNTPDGVKDRETFEKINEALLRNGFLKYGKIIAEPQELIGIVKNDRELRKQKEKVN